MMVLTSCSSQNSFDIRPATNGNYNAIIKLEYIESPGSCSAFVVSDTMAVTAAHCIDISDSFMSGRMQDLLKELPIEIEKTKAELEVTKAECFKDTCSGKVISLLKTIEIKTEYLKKLQEIKNPSLYRVIDVYGNDTKILAVALDVVENRDFGYIYGDFKKFNKLPIRSDFTVKPGDNLRSCGFPNGKSPAICIDFKAIGQYYFQYTGRSMTVPGMSGGPVVNEDGEVVGVNSSVIEDVSTMAPTHGLFNIKR